MGVDETKKKKKLSIIVVSSILLVAVIGGVSYDFTNNADESDPNKSGGHLKAQASALAIKAVCEPTEYKQTCEHTLATTISVDPKDLIKVSFQATKANIDETIRKSSQLRASCTDPMATKALDVCEDVLHRSEDEITKSCDKINALDLDNISVSSVGDLQTWLGAALTFRETCLEAFDNTTGETGEKMKALLKTAEELISNDLSIVSSYAIPDSLGDAAGTNNAVHEILSPVHRRLLQDGNYVFPSFEDETSRRLLSDDKMETPPKPNVVVAQDGSGEFKTITEAIKKVPKDNNNPFVIFIKGGIYQEHVEIPISASRVVLVGEGPTKTKITGEKNLKDGTQTWYTATVAVDGNNFIARDIRIENSAGPTKLQGVALRVAGDNAIFLNCQIDGYHNTLLAHDKRQFYRDCIISGSIDFIYGDAQAVFQNCKLIVRNPSPTSSECYIAVQGRTHLQNPSGFIFQNCELYPAPDLNRAKSKIKVYLGRPWKMYSRTIYVKSRMGGFIDPAGWATRPTYTETSYFAEFENRGPGANTGKRMKWQCLHLIDLRTAMSFMPGKFYRGGDKWITAASIPYSSGIEQIKI